MWGQRYYKTADDPVAVEQAIVTDIAERLSIELTGKQQKKLVTPATHDPEAYRFYLKGRYEWNKRSPEGLRAAKVNFEQAIDRDPAFSLAYAGLADTYILMGGAFRLLPQQEALMRKAQESDPLSPLMASNHAGALRDAGDFDAAVKEVRKALELNPKFAYAHWQMGLIEEAQGRYGAATERYLEMSKVPSPANLAAAALGRGYAKVGRRAEALAIVRELEREWENGSAAPTQIAWVYSALGDRDRAFSWLEKAFASRDVALRDTLFLHPICLSDVRTDPRYADLVERIRSVDR